jgi:hypothetical protein
LKDLSSLLLLIDQLFNNEIQECMTWNSYWQVLMPLPLQGPRQNHLCC